MVGALVLGVLIGAFIVFCAYTAGHSKAEDIYDEMRDEAIKAGVAEYYLDENNEKKFRYKKS